MVFIIWILSSECSRRESRWPISWLCDREERLWRWIVIAHQCAKSQRKSCYDFWRNNWQSIFDVVERLCLKFWGLYNLESQCSRRKSRWPISRLCDREERLRRWIVIAHRCAKSQRKSRIGTQSHSREVLRWEIWAGFGPIGSTAKKGLGRL